jgi:hypothetical protein
MKYVPSRVLKKKDHVGCLSLGLALSGSGNGLWGRRGGGDISQTLEGGVV